eukprot:7944167-Alexandrium_andersonii.AAC.1
MPRKLHANAASAAAHPLPLRMGTANTRHVTCDATMRASRRVGLFWSFGAGLRQVTPDSPQSLRHRAATGLSVGVSAPARQAHQFCNRRRPADCKTLPSSAVPK